MKSIRPIKVEDLEAIKIFTDKVIGKDYYRAAEIKDICSRSQSDSIQCSFLLEIEKQIKGIRITFPPSGWETGKGKGLSPELWPYPLSETAYFQSLFIDPDCTGKGYGRELSLKSIEALKKLGTKGVVCHSWKESPHNSSIKYLKRLGFKSVKEHLEYWKEVDYICTKCQKKPCLCTAEEMYLELV